MSSINIVTSLSRPSSPSKGDVYFESDTNRLLVWDGGMWHVYNRDSMSFTSAKTEEIHYPQGIYSDSTATYYIATSPILHFDSSHIDGLTKTSPYANGEWVEYWHDRTHSRYKYKETRSGADAVMVDSGSSLPFVDTKGATYTPDTGQTPPTDISGEFTLMYVMNPKLSSHMSPAPYLKWYRTSDAFTYNLFAGRNIAPSGINNEADYFKTVTGSTGPCLQIGRNSQANGAQIWRPDERGNTRPAFAEINQTFPYGNGTYDLSTFLHTYPMEVYEVIWWDQALTIAEINTAKDYLQNKYLGLNNDFFPTGGTPDLEDS